MELYNGKIENKPSSNSPSKEKVCSYCSQSSQTVFVHGHEQCVFCGTNILPCCEPDQMPE